MENVVSLVEARQFRRPETGAPAEPVSNPTNAHVLPFRKTAQARLPKTVNRPESLADRDGWHLRFARRLREVRSSLGITEEEAAAAAGRSVLTWRRYETTGRGRCTYAIGRFAKHYDVRLDDLFDDFGPAPGKAPPDSIAGVQLPLEIQRKVSAMVDEALVDPIGWNERLRSARSNVWRTVEAKLDYARAWRDLHCKIRRAFDRGVIDRLDCPTSLQAMNDFKQPWILDNELLNDVMVAERELLLTPAPTVAAMNWKRKRAGHQWYRMPDGSIEKEILQAIDADQNWLDAHPARQCRSNKQRRRRE